MMHVPVYVNFIIKTALIILTKNYIQPFSGMKSPLGYVTNQKNLICGSFGGNNGLG